MALRKTAITMPADLLADIDRAAAARGESRSSYITRVLRIAARARRDADISRAIDELFADSRARQEQLRETYDLATASAWKNERW